MNVGSLFSDHVCFGCGKQIADYEQHIHVTMDEFSASKGLEPLGLDDLLTFPFCSECIEDGGEWMPESHEVSA